MGVLPSRHLKEWCEQPRAGELGMDRPPLMIMRTIAHSVVSALDKNGGKGGGAATWRSRENHVGTDRQRPILCDVTAMG